MPTVLGSVRRLTMTPSLTAVTFERRRFPPGPADVARHLEAIPQAVLCGFEWGIDTRSQWELERRLSLVREEQLGFAYEGATMACTILDAMRGGRGRRTRELLDGPGRPHLFLAYIGIGFAMARLPRPLWRGVVPELTESSPYHPAMSWLAVDGYGFDRAYFDTRKWVERQHVPAPYPWQGRPEYFHRALDQGIGRALWFIHGARPDDVAQALARFAPGRHADLWSGVGLASTFAGGAAPEALRTLRRHADGYRDEVALGMVFAAKARSHARYVPEHTEWAARALGDIDVDAAVALADDTVVTDATGTDPTYELWRRKIRAHFASLPG
ncbi:enediyne biosynthesis protein [Saccharomonospora piscinae]|uniref:Enediyne biosynthesis protein n=1 Tax=Saccharomonospora piscinae TaxID=687388 RepID=A0A1V9A6A4_SACPI|nr:DUF1702 family protein [Saccharomonospora piscinae]OQO92590.1 enediyne biosynthesis protein [Saccharomonospora piscinae]TLW91698.1 DUF1702 family protein [Saccharomonospora piscinae]